MQSFRIICIIRFTVRILLENDQKEKVVAASSLNFLLSPKPMTDLLPAY